MVVLQLGSSLLYKNTLANTPWQSMLKRCDPPRFRPAATAKTTSGQAVVPRRGSANYQPSVWDHDYLLSLENKYAKENKVKERAKLLKEEVRKMLDEAEDSLRQLELIDAIQRLGVSYHFEREIDKILAKFHEKNIESVPKISWNKQDLHATALKFRLLRQHGFVVPQDVFDNFKDENGNFRIGLSDNNEGFLSLYEASYLSTKSETKLKEARSFAMDRLREFVSKSSQTSEKGSYMQAMVIHALEMPLYWSTNRLEARWYIDVYGKKHDMNPLFLEFAKLDFNIVQAVHQEDLKYVCSWWTNTRLATQLDFVRDRMTECYFWTIGLLHEPQFKYHRRITAKVNALITTIDDIYDVHGTLEELELFTACVEKWDVNHLEKLPEHMRLCFLVLYNEVNQAGCDVLREKRFNVIPYLKKAWTDLCKAYLIEAKWHESGYKPSLGEYMQNAWVSISGPTILIHLFCMLSDQISKETLSTLSDYSIVRCSSTVLRLANDLGTSSDEMARGDVPKSIQCYMRENGASESEARAHVMRMVSDTWDEMNCQKTAHSSSLPPRFVEAVANLGRMAQCVYHYGDGHGRPETAKTVDRVLSLLVHPVPLHCN